MASRKEEKERLRREREERERAAETAAGRKRRIGYAVAGALVAAVVIALVLVADPFGGDGAGGDGSEAKADIYPDGGKVPAPGEADLGAAVKAAGCELRNDKERGNDHTEEPVQYKDNPPTSGDHNPIPAEDDIYPRQPRIENLVHTLEHGRIVFQFKPDAPAPVRANLKALYDEDPAHVVLTPNDTGMEAQIAATAWTKALLCPRANDKTYDALRAFKDRYRDRGPEFVP